MEPQCEFWASERKIAAIACIAPSTVHKHIQQFISGELLLPSGSYVGSGSYIIKAYATPASSPEAPETLASSVRSGESAGRLPYDDSQSRSTPADRPSAAVITGPGRTKSQKCEQHRSVESKSASRPEPAPEVHPDAKITKVPTDITDLNSSSRSEGTEKTDPPPRGNRTVAAIRCNNNVLGHINCRFQILHWHFCQKLPRFSPPELEIGV